MKTTNRFSDTASGAISYLASDSTLNLTGATARPDPSVQGVWLVTLQTGNHAIVYLGGYRDPFGKIRESNDFEFCPRSEQ